MSKVRVPEIQYSSTVSTRTEYEYPNPGHMLSKVWDEITYQFSNFNGWSLVTSQFRN